MISRNASELLMSSSGSCRDPERQRQLERRAAWTSRNRARSGSSAGNGVSISGAPYRGGTALLMDGTNIIDEGCDCTSIAVPNPDMVEEVKVQTSAFGADGAKGPVVVDFISKSGGAQYHGEGYFFVRNAIFNSDSWQLNHAGAQRANRRSLLLSRRQFRRPSSGMKKKLFFWFGYEHFYQLASGGTIDQSYVPTADMASGEFRAYQSAGAANANARFASAELKAWTADPSTADLRPRALIATTRPLERVLAAQRLPARRPFRPTLAPRR